MKDFHKKPLRIFAAYYRPHRGMFAVDMLCALLSCFADLAFPYATRYALNSLLPQRLFRQFFILMALLAAAYVLKALLSYVVTRVGHLMGVRIEADMRTDLLTHMQKLSFSFFDENRTGVLMSRVTNDLFNITELSHHGPENLITGLVTLAGAFVILCTVCWPLALIIFAIIPVFILFTAHWRDKMNSANGEVKQKTAEINASIESSISGIRTAKAFANEETEKQKFTAANNAFKTAKNRWYQYMGIYHAGIEFSMSFVQVVTIAAGGLFVLRGRMDVVDLVTFSLYVSTFTRPVTTLSNLVETYTDGMTGFRRFVSIMNTEPAVADKPGAAELREVKGDIEYRHVDFAYNAGVPVLRDISFTLPRGETLAVVGPSGGGKTTLCHLLPRFYDVTGGAVLVDGLDVRDVTQDSLRRSIGILQQDVFVFADTIRENIRYGRPDATDEEILAAAARAELHEEILALPDGYDTYVGERGVMLSGGQKQRLSIARVFLKNPPILILDEATSALDSITEQKIQAAFDELSRGRTGIIIAHRLSTVRNADHIAVIEGERLAEFGTREELLEKNGAFAALWRAQNLSPD